MRNFLILALQASLSLTIAYGADAQTIRRHIAQLGDRLLVSCAAGNIQLDGKLDEAEWQKASAVSGFSISEKDGTKPYRTEVRALHSNDCIYLGISCEVGSESEIVALQPEGGKVYRDDSIEIFLDPHHDGKSCYHIIVNAKGNVTVIPMAGETCLTRSGFLDARASWNENEKAYVLELALRRDKFNLLNPLDHSIGIAFMRNQQVSKGGTRLYRYLWHSEDPSQWGHLALLDQNNFDAWKYTYAGRLDAIIDTDVPDDLKAEAKELKKQISSIKTPQELSDFEKLILPFEENAGWLYWKRKFEALFGDPPKAIQN